MLRVSRRQFVGSILTSTGILSTIGCGTVLHPERRGQPAGPLDWKIVVLDGIGLLLFFVPGVIAFAVDFNNGTIYLPPDHYGRTSDKKEKRLVGIKFPRRRMTVQELEEVVSLHAERDIQLVPGRYQTEQLEDIDQFWPKAESLGGV